MNFIQQAITNIHVANNIKTIITKATDVEYPALIFDNTKRIYGQVSPTNTKEYMELYSQLAPIYRAVNVKARTIAQLPIQILKKTGDNEFEDVTETRPEYKIFKQPNEFQTKFDFWEQAIGYLQLTGEDPWLFERKNAGYKISQMYPLRPDLIKVIPHNRQLVSHYLYWMSGQEQMRIEPEFMLFLKYFNPTDHLRGLSPIAASENEVVLDLNAIKASKQTFESGAQASGLISTDKEISPVEGKRIQKDIQDKYTGTKNFGKLMFLTHGFKYQQMQMNNRDMQYMEQREWNKETIAQVFGVPPILQMRFKDSSILQNTEIQYKLFWDGIQTELIKLEETLTEKLLPEITDDTDVKLKFDLSHVAALQPDMVVKTKRYSEVFGMGGVTPNEIRQDILNKDPIDNPAMDIFYVPFNLQPIEDAGMDIEETSESKAIEFYDKMQIKRREIIIENNGGGLIGEIKTSLIEIKQINSHVEHGIYRQKTINDLNRINNKHIKSFKKVLAGLFKAQEKEVLNNLYRNKYQKFSTEGVTFDTRKWVKKFKDAGYLEIAEALELVAMDLAKEFGEVYDVTDPNAAKYINKRSIDYAKQVNKTSKEKIDKILKAALRDNLSIEETAVKLTKFFDSSAMMRSLRIARTEIVRATNEGRQFAAMQMKKIGFKEWMTQRDGLVRDLHVIMDGEVVPKDSGFSNGSFVPEDINERCYVIYRKKKG